MSLKHIFELNLNSKNEVNKIELKIKDLDNTNLREKQTIWFFLEPKNKLLILDRKNIKNNP